MCNLKVQTLLAIVKLCYLSLCYLQGVVPEGCYRSVPSLGYGRLGFLSFVKHSLTLLPELVLISWDKNLLLSAEH